MDGRQGMEAEDNLDLGPGEAQVESHCGSNTHAEDGETIPAAREGTSGVRAKRGQARMEWAEER